LRALALALIFLSSQQAHVLALSGTRLMAIPEHLWPPPREIADLPAPITAGPQEILAWPEEAWRDARFEVFRWDRFPSLLIIDTACYETQDLMLKRIAFYVEKSGWRGSLAHDEEIADLHGWNAHDYRAGDLASFFQSARDGGFPLGREEIELEGLLLDEGLIWETAKGLRGGDGGIISISRATAHALRELFMAHEGFHSLYFIDADFRAFTEERWNAFPDEGKTMFLTFLREQNYDADYDFIAQKEFASFLLQQPAESAGAYFGLRVPQRIESGDWHQANESGRDSDGSFPAFAEMFSLEAQAFCDFVGALWGFAAGRVW